MLVKAVDSSQFGDRPMRAANWVGCLVSQNFARHAPQDNPYVHIIKTRSDGKINIAVFRDYLAEFCDHVLQEQCRELPWGVVEHAILMFEIKV